MINRIIKTISIALDAEFTEKIYEIHMEEMKQGLKEPCFFIFCLNPNFERFLGHRFFRANPFCIQYFPESEENAQEECNAVGERMMWCLDLIRETTGEKFQGTRMRYEVRDGVLNFFVNYDCFVHQVEQGDILENMHSSTSVE